MVKYLLLFMGILFVYGFSCRAQSSAADNKCCRSLYPQAWDTLDLDQLGKEYKRLKSLKCSDCDHFESDLMHVMEVLGKRLDGSCKSKVRKIMGKADEKEGRQYIYYWRGRHDYLYFSKEKCSRSMKHAWYYAFE